MKQILNNLDFEQLCRKAVAKIKHVQPFFAPYSIIIQVGENRHVHSSH